LLRARFYLLDVYKMNFFSVSVSPNTLRRREYVKLLREDFRLSFTCLFCKCFYKTVGFSVDHFTFSFGIKWIHHIFYFPNIISSINNAHINLPNFACKWIYYLFTSFVTDGYIVKLDKLQIKGDVTFINPKKNFKDTDLLHISLEYQFDGLVENFVNDNNISAEDLFR
jgi:hypothetical protein